MLSKRSYGEIGSEVSNYLNSFRRFVEDGNHVPINIEALKAYDSMLTNSGFLKHAGALAENGADILLGNGFWKESRELYDIAASRYYSLGVQEREVRHDYMEASAYFDKSARIYLHIIEDNSKYLSATERAAECLVAAANGLNPVLAAVVLDRASEHYGRAGNVVRCAECLVESKLTLDQAKGIMRNDTDE